MPKRHFQLLLCFPIALTVAVIIFLYPISSVTKWDGHVLSEDRAHVGEQRAGGQAPKITKLVIHARYRTGSTFTSDFFSHHLRFFYLYEPFKLFPADFIGNYSASLIDTMLDCNFSTIMDFAEAINGPKTLSSWRAKLFCWNFKESCQNYTISDLERRCLRHDVRVIKLIRVPSLEELTPLMEQGVKVIRLVRDPRGVISSRGHIKHEIREDYKNDVDKYCKDLATDLHYSTKISSGEDIRKHLQHIFVRYEDLAADPINYVYKLHAFLGMEPDEFTMNWVKQYEAEGEDWNYTLPREPKSKVKPRTYNTIRSDPEKTSLGWRRSLGLNATKVVQASCREVMAAFAYIPVYEYKQLKYGPLTTKTNIL